MHGGIDGLCIILRHQKVGIYEVQEQKQSVHVAYTDYGIWEQNIRLILPTKPKLFSIDLNMLQLST